MKALDITGQRFGRLIAIRPLPGKSKNKRWEFLCDCGAIVQTRGVLARRGEAKSCGCLRVEKVADQFRKHGHAVNKKTTRTYNAWAGMIRRCFNNSCPQYPEYGGRGITVCKAWNDFQTFLADMGECPPGYSIDRVNNNGNYEPGNCRWATRKQQANNRRRRRYWRKPTQ